MKLEFTHSQLSQIITDEAIKALTEKPVKMTTYERIRLFHEADKMFCGEQPSLKYGKSLYYVLDNCGLPIAKTDLIIGRVPEKLLNEEEEAFFRSVSENSARPLWVTDQGHCSLWWQGLIENGLTGLRKRAEDQIIRHTEMGSSPDRIDFLRGAILVYNALINLALRYSEKAKEEGLFEAAEVLSCIASREPHSFRESIQLLWLVQMVYCSYIASNPTLTYGRMDLLLEKIYERDIETGALTEEDARLLILDYYCKNNLIMGRGEHQMSAADENLSTGWTRNLCYDAPQYMLVGGRRPDGSYLDGPLTHLLIETVVPKFKNPVIEVRYAPDMQNKCRSLWRKIVSKMRDSASMMVYSERDNIETYLKAGADSEDAFGFEHFGCNHPTIPALDYIQLWSAFQYVQNFMAILREWNKNGFEPETTEQLYDAMRKYATDRAENAVQMFLAKSAEAMRSSTHGLIMTDCFHRYSIEAAFSFRECGSKYQTLMMQSQFFASFIDMLTAVDKLVIRDRKMTLARLMEAIDANFEGYPKELALCKSAPKVGSDDDLPNMHSRNLINMFSDILTEASEKILPKDFSEYIPKDVLKTLPIVPRPLVKHSMETDNGHLIVGMRMGATPDGRLAGVPISQNCSPAVGSSCNGLTARLSSVSMFQKDVVAAGAQNVSISPTSFAGEEGLEKLCTIIGGYFEIGGLQVQLTSVDTSVLREAQKNPEAYKDLMVRITGYSAVFVDMTKSAQDDIIRREEMTE